MSNLSLRIVVLQNQLERDSGEVVLTGEIQVEGKANHLSRRYCTFFVVAQYKRVNTFFRILICLILVLSGIQDSSRCQFGDV